MSAAASETGSFHSGKRCSAKRQPTNITCLMYCEKKSSTLVSNGGGGGGGGRSGKGGLAEKLVGGGSSVT